MGLEICASTRSPIPSFRPQPMWLPVLRMRVFVARICGPIVASITVSREIAWDTSGWGWSRRSGRTLKKGDRVISPFLISDGTCEFCREGLPSSCVHGERRGGPNDGGQGEAVRVPNADGTLVVVPPSVEGDEHLLKAILPLTDVMATGHHAAIT